MGLISWIPAVFAEEKPEVVNGNGLMLYLILILAILFWTMSIAKKDFKNRVFTNKMAQLYEQLYLFIENLCVGTIGAHGRKYIPMIMTFWMIIFVGSVIALFFPFSITADLSFNLGMAILAVAYVQWEGIRTNGLVGHISHFTGPKLSGALILITPMIFIIEVVSELMKNLSLSLRLYGNIHGGHEAVKAMNTVGGIFPLGGILLPLKVLTCVVQALIFTLLTCVYLSLVTAHHSEGHEHNHDHELALEPAYGSEGSH